MIKASVVMPTFKRIEQTKKTLKLLLDSDGIGNQCNIEFIVSDCTPDDSLEKAILKDFGNKIKYTRPQYQGISNNKNNGAKFASNQILIFCDSDIEVNKDTLLKTINALKENPKAAAVTGKVIWRGGEKNGLVDRPSSDNSIVKVKQFSYIDVIYSRYISTYKDVFFNVGGYDEAAFNMHGEGSDLSIRYWRSGYPLTYEKNVIIHHVHEAPFSAAIRVNSPELRVAMDLVLLMYKYDMSSSENPNFSRVLYNIFKKYNKNASYKVLQGIVKNLPDIVRMISKIDSYKASTNTLYDFKFLEVFSNKKQFLDCIQSAEERLKAVRTIFN
ncbi:glycosyltransferase [Candidatus Gottesmanbacteria bacterium]|nr:glycosyltransferase [Candidatus Gottesmanbacteria bacterium]